MKKLTFLLGSLGGALAGYVFSNSKLRKEMMEADDPTVAAKILGRHLASDGQVVAKEVKHFAQQHHLDDKVAEGKKYVAKYYESAKGEVGKFITSKVGMAQKSAKKVGKKVMKKAKKMM